METQSQQPQRLNWMEYMIEAILLGGFMLSASLSVALVYHPDSAAYSWFSSDLMRLSTVGLLMGLTAIGLIYSPWGGRSGAHMNPAVTLTFLRLGKIKPLDAFFYVIFQFIGGVGGMVLSWALISRQISDSSVNYVVTVPGADGTGVAFAAETAISFLLMVMVLFTSNRASLAKYTGVFSGILIALFITFEAPISGMSMNPARTFGSAVVGEIWGSIWIYFTAPFIGMLLAAEIYVRTQKLKKVYCAKIHHSPNQPCIFDCKMGEMMGDGEMK